ncbi:MAG: 1,4-dihydroxy-2-naphthoate octaprenyltransferase [Prevotella sp.]|nr:1,4-dihydroxy-2-naphthoate octaprenyltransferase [Candidatus Prevotella equi]
MLVSLFNSNFIRRNSFKAWVLASRPKTLTGAAVPVMIGSACAYKDCDETCFGWIPMVLCFLFAFIMQIDANFINDYYDCVKKKDNEKRLGPERACQQGWVTLNAMKCAIVITTIAACLAGLPLLYYGGIELLLVGILCIAFCFLYTTLFASIGLGDLLVLVFFGLIPVCCTWWVCIPHDTILYYDIFPVLTDNVINVLSWSNFCSPFLLSISCGLVVDTLLIVNNYRDIDNDREVGKITLVVILGKQVSEWLYIFMPAISIVIVLFLYGWNSLNIILAFIPYFLYTGTWNRMRIIGSGKGLNRILGETARNIFIYGIVTCLIIVLS